MSKPRATEPALTDREVRAPRRPWRTALRHRLSYLVLLGAKGLSRLSCRIELTWVGDPPPDPWDDIRLIAFLNHTSLYEWLFVAAAPRRFLRQISSKAVLPSADKTMKRPLVGTFYRFFAGNVVTITRKRDETWERVLGSIEEDSMVLIAPEGRMMRANGLDLKGRPMSIRGGIADILRVLPNGRLLLAYSGGLHHVQIPGQRLPRLWQTIRLALEVVSIEDYVESVRATSRSDSFTEAVKADLQRRRDLHCPH